LLRQKLEGDALHSIEADHKKLKRAASFREMRNDLIFRFEHIAADSKSLKIKFNKLLGDDKTTLGDFLLQFQNLACLIETKISNSDLVGKLRSQVNSQINLFIDRTFAGVFDPPLDQVLSCLRVSNLINTVTALEDKSRARRYKRSSGQLKFGLV
jgi:hypothetical protein